MIALGVHTYFGGFELGLKKAGATVLGSIESWSKAIEWREKVGRPALEPEFSRDVEVDLVFTNPPCSRFSSMSSGAYGDHHKDDLDHFCELRQSIARAEESKAKMFWWETGPLAWNRGISMGLGVARRLEFEHVAMVRFDLRFAGVPQRRPRVHFIHSHKPIRFAPPDRVESDRIATAWEWCGMDKPDGIEVTSWKGQPPSVMIPYQEEVSTFLASRPKWLDPQATSGPAVLSGRCVGWSHLDRWLTTYEWALLMCHPTSDAAVFTKPFECLTALSKGVCPAAARFVYNNVVKPTWEEWPESTGIEVADTDRPRIDYSRGDKNYLKSKGPVQVS